MKKLHIEAGIKTSLVDLINKSQDAWFENYGDLVTRIFTPGFFISKNYSDGSLQDDFKPSVVPDGDKDLIQISIRGRTPAFCYTTGGKVIGLYDTMKISPEKILGYSYYNPPEVSRNADKIYELWAVPKLVTTEKADYLPNYRINGETKPLVQNYIVSLLLIQKGQLPPPVIAEDEDEDTPGSPVRQTPQIPLNTVEGLKICEFTYNGSSQQITNLVDKRPDYRAYIKPELYDFFSEGYLKHDFVLTHSEDAGDNAMLSFFKNEGGNPKLNGRFTLIGAKAKFGSAFGKLTVNAANVDVPVNSIIGVTITPNEYNTGDPLVKPLEVVSLSSYTPQVDFLVLGYYIRVYTDNGVVIDPPESDDPGIGNIDGSDLASPVNQSTSVLYFVNGLPPLPPGHYLSRAGIGSYVLTKDEAMLGYYNKSLSDAKFIKSGNDSPNPSVATHKSDLYHKIDGTRSGLVLQGTQIVPDDALQYPTGKLGYGWLKDTNTIIGYITRESSNGNGLLEICVYNDEGLAAHAIRLQNGQLKTVYQNTNPVGDENNYVTVAYGLLNRGDSATGNFSWYNGKFKFYKPDVNAEFSQDVDPDTLSDNPGAVLSIEFDYDSQTDVIANFFGHKITGVGDPRLTQDGETDVVNRRFLESNTIKKKTTLETYRNIPIPNPGYIEVHAITEPQPELGTNLVIKDQIGNTGSLISKHVRTDVYTNFNINGPGSYRYPTSNVYNMLKSPGLYLFLVNGNISIDPNGVDIELPVIEVYAAVAYVRESEIMSVHSAPSSTGAIVTIPFSFTCTYIKTDFETKYMTVEITSPSAANITSVTLKKLSVYIIKLA